MRMRSVRSPRSNALVLVPLCRIQVRGKMADLRVISGSSSVDVQIETVRKKMEEKERRKKQKDMEAAATIKKIQKRMKEKEQKQRQKEFDMAFKKAARDGRRENQTAPERLKRMVIVLDSTLAENGVFMEALVEEVEEAGIEHRVGREGPVGCVRWGRKQRERIVTDDAQITEVVTESSEQFLLLTLEAQGFAGLVQYSKMAEMGRSLPSESQTLQGFVEDVKRNHGCVTLSLAVEGMETYFRNKKTKTNQQFRKHVLGTASTSADPSSSAPEVSWLDCQEAVVSVQLLTGCTVRFCKGPEQLAEYVITLTKAISEKPFRKETHFSFHPDAATGQKKRVESGSQLSTTWKNQLMQFNNLSEAMASAVVAEYPTPAHLLSAYSSCDEQSAALLLQDITVRRGVGTVASTRRLGPVQSQRVHSLLTTLDPQKTMT